MSEEKKTEDMQVEEETKTVSLQEFLNKSFECLFNQNVHLHRALAQVLQDEFKKKRRSQIGIGRKNRFIRKKYQRRIFALYKGNYERVG